MDYEVGNIFNVVKALDYLGVPNILSSDKKQIRKASHVILPGVGSFGTGVTNLHQLNLWDTVKEVAADPSTPMLCICLGMQLLMERSDELPNIEGLGFIKGSVEGLPKDSDARRPQIGWNEVFGGDYSEMDLMKGVIEHSCFYFVHGYHCVPNQRIVCTYTDFGGTPIVAAFEAKNTMAVQFHPEKSQRAGAKLISNFIEK